MTLDEFRATLDDRDPPDALPPALEALWHDARGNWNRAHQIAQDIESQTGSWIHAYLHRKEGDLDNAGYWYRRARRTMPKGPLEDEWRAIVATFLEGEDDD